MPVKVLKVAAFYGIKVVKNSSIQVLDSEIYRLYAARQRGELADSLQRHRKPWAHALHGRS